MHLYLKYENKNIILTSDNFDLLIEITEKYLGKEQYENNFLNRTKELNLIFKVMTQVYKKGDIDDKSLIEHLDMNYLENSEQLWKEMYLLEK